MLKRFLLLACVLPLAGCFSTVLLTVRHDGSGTIEEVVSVRPGAADRVVVLDIAPGEALFSTHIDALRRAPTSLDELLVMIADLPGVRVARDNEITIEFGAAQAAVASQATAEPDIFLASLARRDGKLVVGKPVNITNNPGYDNQPSFTRDGRAILFSSARGAAPRTTDIYRYDVDAGAIARLTDTPESEYSPTLMPDGLHISAVRVEADGTQRLWKFGLDGRNPELVLSNIKPVGYHAWRDANTVALFILGESGAPATLQIADVRSGTGRVVARGIGRSVLRTPSGTLSFVRQERPAPDLPPVYTIEEISGPDGTPVVLIQPVPRSGDPNLAWMPDGTLLMAHEGTLYSWRRGDRDWSAAADLSPLGLSGVTRLAVSPAGDRLAIVALK